MGRTPWLLQVVLFVSSSSGKQVQKMSKKFINHPDDCVDEALEGLVMTNPGLRILGKQRVVIHESVKKRKN